MVEDQISSILQQKSQHRGCATRVATGQCAGSRDRRREQCRAEQVKQNRRHRRRRCLCNELRSSQRETATIERRAGWSGCSSVPRRQGYKQTATRMCESKSLLRTAACLPATTSCVVLCCRSRGVWVEQLAVGIHPRPSHARPRPSSAGQRAFLPSSSATERTAHTSARRCMAGESALASRRIGHLAKVVVDKPHVTPAN